jgi:hypothetical protein
MIIMLSPYRCLTVGLHAAIKAIAARIASSQAACFSSVSLVAFSKRLFA